MRKSCGVMLAAILLSGCAIMGRQQVDHPIDPQKVAQIHEGMPKEQVTALLGAPQEILFSNKQLDPLVEHAYIYEHERTKYTGIAFAFINFGNMDKKRDRVIVFLDPEGHVSSIGASLYADHAEYGFPFGK